MEAYGSSLVCVRAFGPGARLAGAQLAKQAASSILGYHLPQNRHLPTPKAAYIPRSKNAGVLRAGVRADLTIQGKRARWNELGHQSHGHSRTVGRRDARADSTRGANPRRISSVVASDHMRPIRTDSVQYALP